LAKEVAVDAQQLSELLVDNYTLGELEERLDLTTGDVQFGLEEYVENNFVEVQQMLREDLYL
jgi:hypothetical protein